MPVNMRFNRGVDLLSITLVLLVYSTSGAFGVIVCRSTHLFLPDTSCMSSEYCCGEYNNECCSYYSPSSREMSDFAGLMALFFVLTILICCPIMCYRCCCRRTTSRGVIYTQPGAATAVTVSLPPQQQQSLYPSVTPYPQQTPYPPQYPTNPYYGAPPPAYGLATQGMQQASAPPPTATYG